MLKITGIMLLLLMSALTGCLAADGLKKRVKALKQLRMLIETLRLMIRYEALEVMEISRRLADDNKFSMLTFIPYLNENVLEYVGHGEMTFYEAWDKSVSEHSDSLTPEDTALLRRIGSCLGSCDCEGQIASLTMYSEQADKLISEAEEQYRSKGRLYRSLGAVAGALIAVIAV